MPKKYGLGSVNRFGPRYGRRVRNKVGKIEKLTKAKYTCPYCDSKSVKRESIGIWLCSKCGAKFAGKAYTPAKTS
ncbi:50S ribosomal protein L37ae [Candidatus Woesearchaeota archaeon]|nr:50S ribosomal protein L37ae [Candidatus Woesearchaeota archaeon]